jgi:hypothetical protein
MAQREKLNMLSVSRPLQMIDERTECFIVKDAAGPESPQ